MANEIPQTRSWPYFRNRKPSRDQATVFDLLSSCAITSGAANLTNLTNSVMNGWRVDFQREMKSLIDEAGCASDMDLKNLADAVVNQ